MLREWLQALPPQLFQEAWQELRGSFFSSAEPTLILSRVTCMKSEEGNP